MAGLRFVVTTLIDADEYPAAQIAALYRRRWQAALHLRSLKIVLQMDHLRCKTPHRVRNEFYMHLVGYNLIRQLLAVAAFNSDVEPWTVSFKGALQTITNLLPLLSTRVSTQSWCDALREAIALMSSATAPIASSHAYENADPKTFKLMREPRENYKKRMAA